MNSYTAQVITVSDRAFKGIYLDKSGPLLEKGLLAMGFLLYPKKIVPDEIEEISAAIFSALNNKTDLIITTGGTGISFRDITPEATEPFLERKLLGIPEALRAAGRLKTPKADLSRGVAGVNGKSLLINLPGSLSAISDGLIVISDLAIHGLDQINGVDHGN